MLDLGAIVGHFAHALESADARRPQALNARTKAPYQPGIGPHPEAQTVELVTEEMKGLCAELYEDAIHTAVAYPELSKQVCDLCVGTGVPYDWAVEVKMLRMLGDNGKPNDNMLMHILSPYPAHRSALTDCTRLVASGLGARKAILIYGYDADAWPLEPATASFEALASDRVQLSARTYAPFAGLVHPVHSSGGVFAWELSLKDR